MGRVFSFVKLFPKTHNSKELIQIAIFVRRIAQYATGGAATPGECRRTLRTIRLSVFFNRTHAMTLQKNGDGDYPDEPVKTRTWRHDQNL
ncbi:hypothetical protein Trydic_g23619 [Trypoxylus dichotomus]